MITGFLHPGEMGSSVAAACAGRRVWASENRSPATLARAEAAGIDDVGDIGTLVEIADTIVSVCPPDAALAQARGRRARLHRRLRRRQRHVAGDGGTYRVDVRAPRRRRDRRPARPTTGHDPAVPVGIARGRGRPALGWLGTRRACRRRRARRGVGAQDLLRGVDQGSTAMLLAVLAVANAEGVDADLIARMGHLAARPLASVRTVRPRAARRRPGASPARWMRSRRRSGTRVCRPGSTRRRPRSSAASPVSRTPHRRRSTM